MLQPVTALDKAIEAELGKIKPENRIPKGKVFTPAEEKEMAAMSLEEVCTASLVSAFSFQVVSD